MWGDIVITTVRLISSPSREWKNIGNKSQAEVGFLNRFLHPIFGMIALTSFIGELWLSPDGNLQSALTTTIIRIVAVFAGYYIAANLLNELSSRFDLEKNLFRYQQFVGYSSVVLYLLFFVMPLLPKFNIIWFAATYTFYIVYAGADSLLHLAENKRISFTVIVSLLIILFPLIIKILLEQLVKITA